MKKIIFLLFFTFLLFMRFTNIKDHKYGRFQTFDEYNMIGIKDSILKNPYIFIKKESDTIFIKFSEKKYKDIRYINRGKYWYSITEKELENSSRGHISSTYEYAEKFIYNDTILLYYFKVDDTHRALENNIYRIKYGDYLTVKTKSTEVNIFYGNDLKISSNENSRFKELKLLAETYKKNLTDERIIGVYQPQYYCFYNKIIKNDTLYVYRKKIKTTILMVVFQTLDY
ncbi:hypothetical protein GGR21_004258 [Dysgonomonas hofstadii]|uniref:Uncharacterized protein n=1 Tax=Dysgonomonas hofstadii TaxID=637886 RepID=A0A840CXN5_9BACT|nr:hypothetical protein [Dysgonomonas hofstadii]MBB4038324.1 hypothetical protein [Dysgonomonas hofstadii]